MKKIILIVVLALLAFSCKNDGNSKPILKKSVGRTNTILTVIKGNLWHGSVGDEIRKVFGEHQVGLPQPETLVSMTQVDPSGFTNVMNGNRSVLILQFGNKKDIKIEYNKFAMPQVIVYLTGKDEYDLKEIINEKGKEVIDIFKKEDIKFVQQIQENKKINEYEIETIKDLNISLNIPKEYKLVKDSIGFLWMRKRLKSGIARGDGTNNILVYSFPLTDESKIADEISNIRDEIGKKHIPGSKKEMYMITEKAYTPHIFEVNINGYKAYETRGKWEVKGDFMAGPFINYCVIDKPNNRLIIFEGFTYAPSVNKRDFIFEMEAIGKSLKIK